VRAWMSESAKHLDVPLSAIYMQECEVQSLAFGIDNPIIECIAWIASPFKEFNANYVADTEMP
jgi:hypothetical protein